MDLQEIELLDIVKTDEEPAEALRIAIGVISDFLMQRGSYPEPAAGLPGEPGEKAE